MQKLITRSDIAKYRQISKTPNDDKLNEMILDAQMLDVQTLLGENLYNKIMASPSGYSDLMEGGIYQYNGMDYTNYGLKMVICYFTYARYMMFGSAIDTPYSVVEKLNDNSRPVDTSAKKSIYSLNRDAAFQIWENVKNYLVRTNNPDFNHCKNSTPSRGMRFTKIG
jgi:hypothetical protein